MSDELRFGVTLSDGMSAPAKAASASIVTLATSLSGARSQLASFQGQLSKANALGDVEGHRHYAAAVEASRKNVYDLTRAQGDLGGASKQAGGDLRKMTDPLQTARAAMAETTSGIKEMVGALSSGDAKGAIEGATEALAGMANALDLIYPGLGQVASAAIKVGGAFVAMTAGVIESGVRTALEVTAVNDRLTATFQALGVSGPESGKRTVAMLDSLAARLPQSREQLAQWTKGLEAMGVTDLGELRHELLATASAQAIMGDQGAEAYEKIDKRVRLAVEGHHGLKLAEKSLTALYAAGVNEADIAAKMGMSVQRLSAGLKAGTIDAQAFGNAMSETLIAKGAGPLAVAGRSFEAFKTKALETWNHLFDGIDTKPLMDALWSVVHLGDAGQESGKALHAGMVGAINAIVVSLGHGITEAEVFFLKMELRAMTLEIKFRPLIHAMERMGILEKAPAPGAKPTAPEDTTAHTKTEAVANTLGDTMKDQLIGTAMGGPIAGAITGAFGFLGHAIGNALDLGMNDEIDAVKATGGKLGKAALDGAKETTQSHSPSLAAIKIGQDVSVGFALGMRRGDAPRSAGRQIGGNALAGLSTAPGAAGGAKGSSSGVRVERLEINITAPQGVTDAQSLSVTGLMVAFERLQLASGR